MERRRFLAGLGGVASVVSLAFGTGAFTSVSAKRAVTVDIADDFRAFLRMEPIADEGLNGELTGRSSVNGGKVVFEIPGDDDGENPNALGVGLDSVYEFHDLLEIVNQGTQPVEVYSTYGGDALANLALVRDSGILRDNPPTLDVGEHLDVGLYIDTHGSSVGEYDETLTIVADQPDD